MRFSASGASDPGRNRARNEDSFLVDAERGLLLVADGMGGHRGGEVASQLAVAAIGDYLRRSGAGGDAAAAAPGDLLREAVEAAHRELLAAVARDGALAGMGTTVVGVLLDGGGPAAVVHVGDSRLYRLRDGRLELLTRDHTWVGEQVAAGRLSAEGARVHPLRNVVTRAVGCDPTVRPEAQETGVEPGDLLLLCSDGLTAMLSDDEIRSILMSSSEVGAACRELIEAANARGGVDNITAVVARLEER